MKTTYVGLIMDYEANKFEIIGDKKFDDFNSLVEDLFSTRWKYTRFLMLNLNEFIKRLNYENAGYTKEKLKENTYTERGRIGALVYKAKVKHNKRNRVFEDVEAKMGTCDVQEIMDHCKLNVGLRMFIKMCADLFTQYNITNTIASSAIELFRTRMKKKFGNDLYSIFYDEYYARNRGNKYIDRFYELLAKHRSGGLIYCNTDESVHDYVYVYDFKSYYPSLTNTINFPVGSPRHYINSAKVKYRYRQENQVAFQWVKVSRIKPKSKNVIPLRLTRTKYILTGKQLLDKNESYEMLLSDIEIEYLIKNNSVKIEYGEYWLFNTRNDLFKDFNDFLYEKKESTKKEGRMLESYIFKIMINSYLGKLAVKPSYFYQDFGSSYTLKDSAGYAYLLAYARINISNTVNELMKKFGRKYYLYTDTDSIHSTLTPNKFAELSGIKLGSEMGCVDVDKFMIKASYWGLKNYHYLDERWQIKHVRSGNLKKQTKLEQEEKCRKIFGLATH